MMPALQYLRHGKALCGKVFKRFVETFNYHNDFIANLKGDGDLQKSDGCIEVDRTDPTHPVIRLNSQKLKQGDFEATEDVGCYAVSTNEDGDPCFANCYFMCGGKIYEGPNGEPKEGFAALSIPCRGDDDPSGATIETYDTFAELKAAGSDYSKYTIPLYKFDEDDDGNIAVEIDFRNMPSAAMGEAGL